MSGRKKVSRDREGVGRLTESTALGKKEEEEKERERLAGNRGTMVR